MLPGMPDGHKCRRLHGHSYRVEIAAWGPIDAETGLLFDSALLDDALAACVELVDHRCLNDAGIPGLSEHPTGENIAAWFFRECAKRSEIHSYVERVTVWEGPRSVFVVKRGDVVDGD